MFGSMLASWILWHRNKPIAAPRKPATAKDWEKPTPKPSIEQKREWEHGNEGKGKDCNRAKKPIYTAPNERPGVCRDYQCDNTEYMSKGLVEREKGTKKILTRDGKKVE